MGRALRAGDRCCNPNRPGSGPRPDIFCRRAAFYAARRRFGLRAASLILLRFSRRDDVYISRYGRTRKESFDEKTRSLK